MHVCVCGDVCVCVLGHCVWLTTEMWGAVKEETPRIPRLHLLDGKCYMGAQCNAYLILSLEHCGVDNG